jgi:spore germination protein GerM
MTAVHRVVLLLVGILLAPSCGVPAEEQATSRSSDDVPFELLTPETTTATTAIAPIATEEVTIYLIRGEQELVAVERDLVAPVTLQRVVQSLSTRPSTQELTAGLRSALPDDPVVRSVSTSGGIATVDLAGGFIALAGSDQVFALAQLVYSLTARPGVGRIAFTLDGASTEIPRADGTLTAESVSREDYAIIGPPDER